MSDCHGPAGDFFIGCNNLHNAMEFRSWHVYEEDTERPETIQAMQIVVNLPKEDPAPRHVVLAAAARAVVAVCMTGQEPLNAWYRYRIRKVTRRARNKAWEDVQAVPGITVDNIARAFLPSPVGEVDPRIAKLQIGHTDLPAEEQVPAPDPARPLLLIDASLGMTLGKAAAQAGHGSMLLAAHITLEEALEWTRFGYPLEVREVEASEFAAAVDAVESGARRGVVIRDAGLTEIPPDSATVVAMWPQPDA